MRALLVLGLVACNGGADGTPSDDSVAHDTHDTAPEECTLPLTCAEAVQPRVAATQGAKEWRSCAR